MTVATGVDQGLTWHYGDPVAEQRLLSRGEAIVELSNRAVVTVTGADRLTWLDTLSTQRLRDLQPGQSREALILSPHGHVESALHVVDDGQTVWLIAEPGAGEPLVAHLEKMKFMLRVEIADRSTDFAVIGYVPGGAVEASGQLNGLSWDDPWPAVSEGGFAYGPVDGHPGAELRWREVIVPREQLARIDAPRAGTWASEALRVAAWRPRFGCETDHRTIPHEVDWLRTAVHLQKGCYRGQETVALVKNLGRPPRRIVFLHLDGSEHVLPEPGAAVSNGDRVVGRVTTAARHHELGPIALAVVKRSVPVDIPLTVEVDGVALAANQEQIVSA